MLNFNAIVFHVFDVSEQTEGNLFPVLISETWVLVHDEGDDGCVLSQRILDDPLDGSLLNQVVREIYHFNESIIFEAASQGLHKLLTQIVPLKHNFPKTSPVLNLVHLLVKPAETQDLQLNRVIIV